MPLEEEIRTYDRLLPELLVDEGKFVVILGDRVLGVFYGRTAALEVGYATGAEAFLCRQILKEQPVVTLPTMFRVLDEAPAAG